MNNPNGRLGRAIRRVRGDATARHLDWAAAVLPPAILTAISLRLLRQYGYVDQVDAVFGPQPQRLSWALDAPIVLLERGLQLTLGGMAAGKIYAAAAVFLVGFGAMVATRRLPWAARCCAALLATLNPWVYDRVSEGQYGVAAAAGALLLWLAAYDALQSSPRLKEAAGLALATVLVVSLSANFTGILAVLAGAAMIASRPWRDPVRRRWTFIAVGLSAASVLYGVIPFFVQHGPGTYAAVQSFSRADWTAFRPTPDTLYGPVASLAGLYGEWAERTGRIPVATSGNPWWIITSVTLVGLAVAGALGCRRRRWLLVAGVIGVGLSAFTSTSWGLEAAVWLSNHVPLVAAYRDTEKWTALWLVALVVLGAEAVAASPHWLRRPWTGPAAAAVMALATLLPAGVNTLRELPRLTAPVAYPADWYAAAEYLRTNVRASEPVAVLPWHLYEPLPFTGRLTANPAPVFFPGTLIVPNDPELPGQTAPPPSPGDIGTLAQSPSLCALADGLRGVGVRWVVLEQTVGSDDALRRLRSCGFRVVEGGTGLTSVLQG